MHEADFNSNEQNIDEKTEQSSDDLLKVLIHEFLSLNRYNESAKIFKSEANVLDYKESGKSSVLSEWFKGFNDICLVRSGGLKDKSHIQRIEGILLKLENEKNRYNNRINNYAEMDVSIHKDEPPFMHNTPRNMGYYEQIDNRHHNFSPNIRGRMDYDNVMKNNMRYDQRINPRNIQPRERNMFYRDKNVMDYPPNMDKSFMPNYPPSYVPQMDQERYDSYRIRPYPNSSSISSVEYDEYITTKGHGRSTSQEDIYNKSSDFKNNFAERMPSDHHDIYNLQHEKSINQMYKQNITNEYVPINQHHEKSINQMYKQSITNEYSPINQNHEKSINQMYKQNITNDNMNSSPMYNKNIKLSPIKNISKDPNNFVPTNIESVKIMEDYGLFLLLENNKSIIIFDAATNEKLSEMCFYVQFYKFEIHKHKDFYVLAIFTHENEFLVFKIFKKENNARNSTEIFPNFDIQNIETKKYKIENKSNDLTVTEYANFPFTASVSCFTLSEHHIYAIDLNDSIYLYDLHKVINGRLGLVISKGFLQGVKQIYHLEGTKLVAFVANQVIITDVSAPGNILNLLNEKGVSFKKNATCFAVHSVSSISIFNYSCNILKKVSVDELFLSFCFIFDKNIVVTKLKEIYELKNDELDKINIVDENIKDIALVNNVVFAVLESGNTALFVLKE